MSNISHTLRLITLYSAAADRSENTIARLSSGDGRTAVRLKAGCDITTRRAARIAQWFSDNWPVGLPWPQDIPRPPASPDSPAALENPLRKLNAKGRIASPEKFAEALGVAENMAIDRTLVDQVIAQYADGKPRGGTTPRFGSKALTVLKYLIAAGDSRFAEQIAWSDKRMAKFAATGFRDEG